MFNPFVKKINEQEEQHKFNTREQIIKSAMDDSDQVEYRAEKEEKDNLTRWQQDLEPELQLLVHDLKREFYDGNGWVKEIGDDDKPVPQICNDVLIRKMVTLLRPLVSRNLIMSNYSEENIQTELRSTNFAFIENLGYNYQKYAIDKGDLSIVVRLFKSVARPTFYRAFNAGERNLMKHISKEHTIRTTNDNFAKKKGLMGG